MNPHILVYDHNAAILARFQHGLQQYGYRATARFPREININQVEMLKPSLIILGVTEQTPPTDFEKIQRVRDNPTTQQIPVIISPPRDAKIAMDIAPDEMITIVPFYRDPFNMDDVIAEVVRLVGEPQPSDETAGT